MKPPDTVFAQLQARGERLTIQRRMVIEALCSRDDHLSIQDIQHYIAGTHPAQTLQDPTVYRILQWLKDAGLVSQTDMGESGIVYELIGTPPHHHLICLNCGEIIEVNDRFFIQLRQQLAAQYHFEARIEHMAIYGSCQGCGEPRQRDQVIGLGD